MVTGGSVSTRSRLSTECTGSPGLAKGRLLTTKSRPWVAGSRNAGARESALHEARDLQSQQAQDRGHHVHRGGDAGVVARRDAGRPQQEGQVDDLLVKR